MLSLQEIREYFFIDFKKVDWKNLPYKEKFKLTVLLVEDDKSLRETLYEAFNFQMNYDIDVAENGLEGLELYREKEHQLVITDVNMPIMSGVIMTDKILKITPGQKIFFISGWVDEKHVYNKFPEQFKSGKVQFVKKPVDVFDLQNRLYLFQNDKIAQISLNLLDDEQYEKTIKFLSPYQITALQREIWDQTFFIHYKLLEKELRKEDLTRNMMSTADYMHKMGCNYDLAFCQAKLCMQTSPVCASQKIKEQIDVIRDVLKDIYSKSLKKNKIEE